MEKDKNKRKKSNRTRGEGCVVRRKDGIWTARINIGRKANGKQNIKAFYGKTRLDAVRKLDEYKSLHRRGENETNSSYFDTYILYWLNNIKINELKPLSFDRLESTVMNHIIPTIGHFRINEISDYIIQTEVINPKIKTLSYSSIKKIRDSLNACFKYAIARRDLIHNPMSTVAMPSKSKFECKKIDIFTDEEIRKLIKVAKSKYKTGTLKYKNGWGIILMIFTGIRMGEAIALKWSDFDRERKQINVRRNIAIVKNRSNRGLSYNIIEQSTAKTSKSERTINLSEMAYEALNQLEKTSREYIMSTKDGNPIRPRNLQNMFDSMLKEANIPHKGLHTTRHTFASMLFKMGADIKTVSELLGHTDIRITSNTYIHLIEKQKQKTIDLLNNALR